MAKKDKAAKAEKTKGGKATMVVDFTKDTSSGGRRRFPEGDYKVKIVAVKTGTSKEKGTPFVQLAFEFLEGKFKGSVLDSMRTRVYVTDSALWRVRSLYEAIGKEIPKKKVTLDFSKLIGSELGITLSDGEPYEGRISSEVTDFIDAESVGAGVDDDEDDDDTDSDDEDSDLELEDDDDL